VQYLSGGVFEPKDIQAMSSAFEEVCKALEIQPGATREREAVAVRLIELCRRGERRPARLAERVLKEAGLPMMTVAALPNQRHLDDLR
jgi:hypothetical protein